MDQNLTVAQGLAFLFAFVMIWYLVIDTMSRHRMAGNGRLVQLARDLPYAGLSKGDRGIIICYYRTDDPKPRTHDNDLYFVQFSPELRCFIKLEDLE